MDCYCVVLYALLFCSCFLHQLTVRIDTAEKLTKHPLRKFYLRVCETIGRCSYAPLSLIAYFAYFRNSLNAYQANTMISVIVLFPTIVLLREHSGLKKEFWDAIAIIQERDVAYFRSLFVLERVMIKAYEHTKLSMNNLRTPSILEASREMEIPNINTQR